MIFHIISCDFLLVSYWFQMTSYWFCSDSLLKVRICRPLHGSQHLLRQTCLLCQMGLVASFWHIRLRATYAQTYAQLCVSDLDFKGNRGQRNKQDLWFPIDFLWFPIDVLWFPIYFIWFPMGFLLISCWFHMTSYWFPRVSYWFPMISYWLPIIFYRFPMISFDFLWSSS